MEKSMQPQVQSEQDKMVPIDTSGDPVDIELKEDDKKENEVQVEQSTEPVVETKVEEKFPTGPWCKEDDWVLITRYAGSRIRIDGGELRIINDDEILAVIDDPRDILPANIL